MRLPAGSTGFGLSGGDQARSLRDFVAACHHAARTVGGEVVGAAGAGVTPNFHSVDILRTGRRTTVLRHVTVPYAAFTESGRFIDDADLAAALGEVSELRILTARELETPLSQADLSALAPDEHRQITYWQPATVGELLFNTWD